MQDKISTVFYLIIINILYPWDIISIMTMNWVEYYFV